MQRIAPCLWFDNQAEEAVQFYLSIFKNSKILTVSRYGDSGAKVSGRPKGSVMTITFRLDGQDFMALNGGPLFKFTEAVSLMVYCRTQQEIDRYWKKLSEGGKKGQCGWLKDRYGLSWQIVPAVMEKVFRDNDAGKLERVMKAVLQMTKPDIEKLKRAYGR